jgi:hypothetical protein
MKRHYKRLANEFFGKGTLNHLAIKNIFLNWYRIEHSIKKYRGDY